MTLLTGLDPENIAFVGNEGRAWVAGLFDGEGHCGRNPKRNTLYAEISQSSRTNTFPEILIRAQEIIGFGKVNGPYYSTYRTPMYRLQFAGYTKVNGLYQLLKPWLGSIKANQFEECIGVYLELGGKLVSRRSS